MAPVRVTATGLGVVCAIGEDAASFAASLRQGRCGVRAWPEEDTGEAGRAAALLPDFDFARAVDRCAELPESLRRHAKRTVHRAPTPLLAAVAVALQAWQDARLHETTIDAERVAVIVGGANLTRGYTHAMAARFAKSPAHLPPRYAMQFMDTDHVGALSAIFGARGEGFTVGGASASGGAALVKGMQLVRAGEAEACLVVGALAELSPVELQSFFNVGAMAGRQFADRPQAACRPFDRGAEGFVYGQGCASLLLESEASAARRGVAPRARLAGGALALDGNRQPDPSAAGEARVMRAALAQAGTAPEDVDYVNAHGTSSPLGDAAEAQAVREVFGDRAAALRVNATKGLTGHCLYAAGVLEAAATVLQMQGGFLHPNLNLENPIADGIGFCGPEAEPGEIRLALSNSFGFGGVNTCLALRPGERREEAA